MKHSSSEQFDRAIDALRSARGEAPDPQFVSHLESQLQSHLSRKPMNTFFQRLGSRPVVPVVLAGFAVLIAAFAIAWTQFRMEAPKTAQKEPLFHRLLIQEAQAQ